MKKSKNPSFKEEEAYWKNGILNVIGLDEVGRGAFAGPIVAAGVIYKPNFNHLFLGKVNDSKLLKPKIREELSEIIKANSIWTIEEVNIDFINMFGIGKANTEVLKKVILKLVSILKSDNYFAIVDGFDLKIKKQRAIVKGDSISLSIASASIIAKVYRDNLMRNLHLKYPEYNFFENKGYGTKFHRSALKKYGLSKIHRASFNLNKYL